MEDQRTLDELAVVDGVEVRRLDRLNESFDANGVAEEVASRRLELLGQVAAESRTRSEHSNVEDVVHEVLNDLVHDLHAEVATDATCLRDRDILQRVGDDFRDLHRCP